MKKIYILIYIYLLHTSKICCSLTVNLAVVPSPPSILVNSGLDWWWQWWIVSLTLSVFARWVRSQDTTIVCVCVCEWVINQNHSSNSDKCPLVAVKLRWLTLACFIISRSTLLSTSLPIMTTHLLSPDLCRTKYISPFAHWWDLKLA